MAFNQRNDKSKAFFMPPSRWTASNGMTPEKTHRVIKWYLVDNRFNSEALATSLNVGLGALNEYIKQPLSIPQRVGEKIMNCYPVRLALRFAEVNHLKGPEL